jgi:hypothetical protein
LKAKIILLFAVLLVLVGSALAAPISVISNVVDDQTVVVPAQPVEIGGGGGHYYMMSTGLNSAGALSANAPLIAGTPYLMAFNVTNPNNYTVSGTFYINFTMENSSIAFSNITIYAAPNNELLITKLSEGPYLLVRVQPEFMPDGSSPGIYFIQPGFNINLVQIEVIYNAPATYDYIAYFGQ